MPLSLCSKPLSPARVNRGAAAAQDGNVVPS